jgi:hypothetical protein
VSPRERGQSCEPGQAPGIFTGHLDKWSAARPEGGLRRGRAPAWCGGDPAGRRERGPGLAQALGDGGVPQTEQQGVLVHGVRGAWSFGTGRDRGRWAKRPTSQHKDPCGVPAGLAGGSGGERSPVRGVTARAPGTDGGEFDPGSGSTLAACLMHASRTGAPSGALRGGRVRNTWPTCPRVGGSPRKRGVIPHTPAGPVGLVGKGLRVAGGGGCGRLAGWGGNGLPRR